MGAHKERAILREEANNPINFTCGVCKKAVPFRAGYRCINCNPDKKAIPPATTKKKKEEAK